jgi:hypothetical protein
MDTCLRVEAKGFPNKAGSAYVVMYFVNLLVQKCMQIAIFMLCPSIAPESTPEMQATNEPVPNPIINLKGFLPENKCRSLW